jgi:LysR family glycine cleavage system transcriptional activator
MAQLPPLNALRAFDAAGRHLNFRAAADEMGVTQGAVAQQLHLLEAHLGVPLFDRLPKGLAFTSPGRGYHTKVAAAFTDLRSATDILRPEPGKVLVSVTPTFAAKWLIPILPEFSAAHPEIDLRILATEKVSSFYGDGIDLAVRQAQLPFWGGTRRIPPVPSGNRRSGVTSTSGGPLLTG